MQYLWHKGDNIFAGGLFTDVTYVVDTSQLPEAEAQGRQPADRHAVRLGPGRLLGDQGRRRLRHLHGRPGPARSVHLHRRQRPDRQRLRRLARASWSGSTRTARRSARRRPTPETAETEQRCDNIPALPQPTCANPHGVQAREDLDTLVTSDYNEPRNIILNPVSAPSSYLRRPTVRTWDISDQDNPKLKAVSFLPDGPRGRQGRRTTRSRGRRWRPRSPTCPSTRARSPRRCRAARSTTRPTSPSTSRSGVRSST